MAVVVPPPISHDPCLTRREDARKRIIQKDYLKGKGNFKRNNRIWRFGDWRVSSPTRWRRLHAHISNCISGMVYHSARWHCPLLTSTAPFSARMQESTSYLFFWKHIGYHRTVSTTYESSIGHCITTVLDSVVIRGNVSSYIAICWIGRDASPLLYWRWNGYLSQCVAGFHPAHK